MSGSNASHILTIADIKTVLEELANEVTSKWYQIGIQLEVRLDNLNSLRQQNTGDNTANLCHVLVTWIKSGKATWEALCKALESSTVAENALAGKLRTDYCMPSSAEGENIHVPLLLQFPSKQHLYDSCMLYVCVYHLYIIMCI